MKYSSMHMHSFNFLKQVSEWQSLGKCSPCVPALEEDYCADRRDATRRDHMKLVVATRVSKGGDAETLTSWCTAQIISDLIFQSSSRVCLNGCWCGGGRLWSDSRRLFPGQWALLQPAEPPVSGWVRQLDRFTDRLIEWFKSAFYWGKMTILDIIYWPVCMCMCV